MSRITFHHHGCRLEDGHGDLSHRQLLMVSLLRRDDRGIGRQHEVDSGVRDQIGLELRDVNVQGSIKAQRRCQAGDDLSDETVQVCVRRALNVQVPDTKFDKIWSVSNNHDNVPTWPKQNKKTKLDVSEAKMPAANVIQRLVVVHDGHVRMLEERMHAQHLSHAEAANKHVVREIYEPAGNTQKRLMLKSVSLKRQRPRHGVVRLNHRGGNLRAAPNSEGDLALLAIVDRQALEHEAAKTGSGAAAALSAEILLKTTNFMKKNN